MATTKASLLTHPIRAKLILALSGRQLTTTELADLLPNVPRTSLYRQIRILVKGEVFEVVGETQIRGTVEKRLAVRMSSAMLTNQEVSEAGHAEFLQLVTSYLGGVSDVYEAYLAKHEDHLEDNVLMRVNAVYLSDDEFQKFRKELTDMLSVVRGYGAAPGRRRRVVGLLAVPDVVALPAEDIAR